ncbi:MAG: hypothetical protein BHV61_00585 [Collinsella sp. 60_9]|nr:MAG: hypothetical protein BHV61_00585 [Collinsella sp. 60_9]
MIDELQALQEEIETKKADLETGKAEEEAAQKSASAITEDHGYTSLTYTNSTATLSFTQDEDGNWIWADDPEFPLDDSTITYIIQTLQSLKPQQTITDGDTLEAYGLDQPSATLTATDAETGEIEVESNNAGGILGGISTGAPVMWRMAVKPTPSIGREQQTVDMNAMENAELSVQGRHDPCIVPRAVPVAEAAAALAIWDALLEDAAQL